MTSPLVTVFMAAYNAEKYIQESIESVLNQTYRNIELLIIDDGSTDGTLNIIRQVEDPRIRLLQNDQNLGLFYTRNRGIDEARGEYFAVNDADDVSRPDRIEKQLEFLQSNKSFVFCGASAFFIDAASERIGFLKAETDTKKLPIQLVFHNAFVNSTLMFKTPIIKEYRYRRGYEPAEDYEMFSRISFEHPIANCADFLVSYRLHQSNVSKLKNEELTRGEQQIIRDNLKRYNIPFDERDIRIHFMILTKQVSSVHELKQIVKYLEAFYNKAVQQPGISKKYLKKVILDQIFRCTLTANMGLRGLYYYLSCGMFHFGIINYKQLIKLTYSSLKGSLAKRYTVQSNVA